MELFRWMALTFARFVAVSVGILSGWMFFNNLVNRGFEPWDRVWILTSGLAGAVGGVVYLLSLDGPARFRSARTRTIGWAAMLAAVLLPTSLTLMLVPLVLLLVPTLFMARREHTDDEAGTVTSG